MKRIVFIDAGHGGSDAGASIDGVNEKDVALFIALLTGQLLEQRGYVAEYSRDTDEDMTAPRAAAANFLKAACFVSIHCGSSDQECAHGIETFYRKGDCRGATLAKAAQPKLIAVTNAKNRLVRGVTDIAELNDAIMPAIRVNVGFLSHDNERYLLDTPAYKQSIAGAIAEAIDAYLSASS